MTTTRRILTLAGLVLAVIVGTTIPASATFADSTSAPTMTIATGTVAAPTGLWLNDYCVTTTTTVRRTVYTDPVTGVQTQTAYSSSSSTATSTTNVQSSVSTPVAGPGANETTTTTVSKNTNLHVTFGWTASPSPRVTGYLISAFLGIDGSTAPLLTTTATSVSQVNDADMLYYQPRLKVTTLTAYGWTADSGLTALLSC
ncbi:hypothetical protein GCM10010531_37660 [Blastococcus jejuensis]|uniref:Fibronectin type-III domain-containing protein n=1 Tax=Blastococcus jejuensis TaxID=351224 RepID=A0ABP6PLG8_9ACTN